MDNMILDLKKVGLINNADIEINKLNIVGGKNSTGKSTSSKLFYCFLRANSSSRQELALSSLYSKIVSLINDFRRFNRYINKDDSQTLLIDRFEGSSKDSISRKLREFSIKYRRASSRNISFNEIMEDYSLLYDMYCESLNEEQTGFIKQFLEDNKLADGKLFEDPELFPSDEEPVIISNRFRGDSNSNLRLFKKFKELSKLIDIVDENSDEVTNFIFKKLLYTEFNHDFRLNKKPEIKLSSDEFKFSIDNLYDFKLTTEGLFEVNSVYYLDSFSIFDIAGMGGLSGSEHVVTLLKDLKDKTEAEDIFDEVSNEKIIKIEKDIANLIGGKIIYEHNSFQYHSSNNNSFLMSNTASGIKQIATIQLLLANRKLKDNSFLIIDEPEVNLHPYWQIKFAEILILLVKELNITLYINSHSPMFIEAICTFSEIYEIEDKTNYYLTQDSDNEEYPFNINKIPSNQLGIIYDNLGDPYDELDERRMKYNLNR